MEKLRGENQRLKSLGENGVDYRALQQKLIREQQSNKELEDEVIQLKMERSNQNGYVQGQPPGQQDGGSEEYFRGLSDEIKRLQTELLNEKQISNHIQITQEKELLLKDREIQRLSAMFNPLGVISKISKGRNKADLAALMSRRGLETSDTETEETLSLSYHDAMSGGEEGGKDRILDADEISLG